LQSIDRIHRLGLPPGVKVTVHILIATHNGRTIDGLVDASLNTKERRMKQLLEGAELGPIDTSADPLSAAQGTPEDLAALLMSLLGEGWSCPFESRQRGSRESAFAASPLRSRRSLGRLQGCRSWRRGPSLGGRAVARSPR